MAIAYTYLMIVLLNQSGCSSRTQDPGVCQIQGTGARHPRYWVGLVGSSMGDRGGEWGPHCLRVWLQGG